VNLYRTDGIVLRTRPLGEADKVLTLLSRDRGKIEVVARGARRPRNRLAAAAQPFSYLKILVFTGRSLDQLSQAEIVKAFGLIRENLVRMAYASFWSEFLDLLLPLEEENTGLFLFTLAGLTVLEQADDPILLSRAFELRALQYLGYLPELTACAQCGGSLEETPGGFSPAAGGVLCSSCKDETEIKPLALSAGGLELMRRLLTADLRSVITWEIPAALQREVESALTAFLEYRSEKPIKSLGFLQSILSF
jgi:DNA repair protein RecO (recombination protein O)